MGQPWPTTIIEDPLTGGESGSRRCDGLSEFAEDQSADLESQFMRPKAVKGALLHCTMARTIG
jgi:hypothetical protein